MSKNNKTIAVRLPHHRYDIIVGAGLLDHLHDYLAPFLNNQRVFIITDKTVAKLQQTKITAQLKKNKITSHWLVFPSGEKTKNWDNVQKATDFLLNKKVERRDLIVALGGGVIGDLTGFVASITLRGLSYIQIPTTLLSQVDSSVGGKTGINTKQGKNLAGSFYHPQLVLADTNVLKTLPRRQLLAGYAEVIKHALITSPALFAWYDKHAKAMLGGNVKILAEGIAKSIQVKAKIVEADEKEAGKRMLLNFGHTFGHAFEAAAGFSDKLLHGEAVALGLLQAFSFATDKGLSTPLTFKKVVAHFKKVGLASIAPQFDSATILTFMSQDKKNRNNTITLILPKAIGQVIIKPNINKDELKAFLRKQLKR